MDDNREIKIKKSESSSKFDNFWYYYKWHVIISIIVVFVVLVCTVQACSKEEEDVSMIYAGSSTVSTEKHKEIAELFSSLLPEDYNKDGKKKADLVKYLIYSEKEIDELQGMILPDGSKFEINTQQNSTNYTTFSTDLMTGKSSICFLSKDIYENLYSRGRVRPLSDIFGEELPLESADGYSVRLGETDLYKYNSSLQALGEDTVVCLLCKLVNTSEKDYEISTEVFKCIIEYKVEK